MQVQKFDLTAGDVEELPEDAREYNPSIMRIRPTIQEEDDLPSEQQIVDATGRGGQAESSGMPANVVQETLLSSASLLCTLAQAKKFAVYLRNAVPIPCLKCQIS